MKITNFTTCILLFFSAINFGFSQYKENSILAEGEIYKLAINSSGIYKIDRTFLETSLNIDLNNIDPRNISIYGNGGGILPEAVMAFRHDDLAENAIFVSGESDGRFDINDFILFYAEGPDKWIFDSENESLSYEKNIYDLNNYYFLKINNSPGLRIAEKQNVSNPEINYSLIDVNIHYEIDEVNLLGSFSSTEGTGQRWYGEAFSSSTQLDFSPSFQVNSLKSGTNAKFKIEMAARSSVSTNFEFNINNEIYNLSIPNSSIGNVEASYAQHRSKTIELQLDKNPQISITYNGNSGAIGWLDYIEMEAQADLVYSGNPLFIYNKESTNFNTAGFNISGISNDLILWEISDPTQVNSYSLNTNGNSGTFGYETQGMIKSFVLFNRNGSYAVPEFIEIEPNQNLHALKEMDLLIIYDPIFEEPALKLANHRASHDDLGVAAVTIGQIYNEFSSGRKDVTAVRDFSKMLHTKFDDFNYLLLFGDGSYDYRGIVEGIEYQNYVPTYETKESLSPIYGFPSDDYFALLSDNEGVDNLKGALDISVGRLPARNIVDANAMVDKIIHYDTKSSTLGEWKLNVGFAADDEDDNTHLEDSEEIAVNNELVYPLYNQQKVYFDAYEQVSTPGGERYPDANEAINQNVGKGQLVLNYLGHGGPKGWSQERVIQVNDLTSWDNRDKMPIIVTATCSFTGFDDPGLITAGEHAIANAAGGAVALFTTVRAVFASENKRLASAVFDQLFEKPNGEAQRLGDILRLAKNDNPQDTLRPNARKFALIGDPSMQISLPKHQVIIEKINQIALADFTDTLSALSSVTVEGKIADRDDNLMANFDGEVYLTVFDKHSRIKTLGTDSRSQETEFFVRKNVLFKGSASVVNGKFSISFILPKDINFIAGEGKLSFYAHDNESQDAAGYIDDIIIGGSSGSLADDTPPVIKLYMNDVAFVNGGVTNDSPTLLVKLNDDFGINVSGTSIGHDLTMVLDDQIDQTIILNDFYEADTDNYKSGMAQFPLKDLSLGLHRIKIKAWDISNNSNEAILEFNVIENEKEELFKALNYPNPFTINTNFAFEHDLGDEDINISVNIYTNAGKIVRTIETSRLGVGYRVSDVFWDGRDNAGTRLPQGIYFYKIHINALKTGQMRVSEFGKLILL